MKKYYFNYILAAALTLSSCADLEQSSISSIDKENFYQSKEDIETAINGVYQEFTVDGFYGMFNNQSVYFNDLQTDYVKAGAQTNSAHIRELSNFAIQPTNLFVSYAWEEHYTAINRANVVIDKVTDASFLDEQSKQNYINEARFLRGFTYFNLVRYFGGVPIVLHDGDGEGAPRNTIDEVYHQIVEDFTAAENLPADYTTLDSKANSLAASAILSKVYLTWAQTLTEEGKANQAQFYQKAIQYADKVINSKKYHLQATAPLPPTGTMPSPCYWLPATSITNRPTHATSVVTVRGPRNSITPTRARTSFSPFPASASTSTR